MPSPRSLAVGTALVASIASAQVLQLDIVRRQLAPMDGLHRRAGTVNEIITNERTRGGYFTTISMGTPAQNLTLQLDTGSSDIWVPYSGSSVCSKSSSSSSSRGCSLGSFNPRSSSTFKDVGQGKFSISYVDGSGSKGDYFTDVFEIAGATLQNMTMGLGLTTDIPYGLAGVGYALNEAIISTSRTTSSAYNNLPLLLQKEGLIATTAYSLWLNDLGASTGTVLFGGIDTAKYDGTLSRIDIQKDQRSGAFTSFTVYLTSITGTSPSGSDSLTSSRFPVPVILDSGTTFSYLPNDLAAQIWNEVGATYSRDAGVAILPCSLASSKGSFEFGFAGPNGPKISVGMDELVLPLVTSGDPPRFSAGAYQGQTVCQFGIQNFTSEPFLFGDTFLRSAYVVYDLVNNQIAIAKTKFNATDSNIVAFASQGAQIPSATVVGTQVTASSAATGALSSPTYAAGPGFGVKNAALPAADVPSQAKLVVVLCATLFLLFGSGSLLL